MEPAKRRESCASCESSTARALSDCGTKPCSSRHRRIEKSTSPPCRAIFISKVKLRITRSLPKQFSIKTDFPVNPSDAGIYDRVVITDIIKQIAQTNVIDANGQRDFRVIVLSEVDELTKDAQHALRRTMEKYVATCRLILCVNSTSRVIPAIKSRCLGIRVAAPSCDEIVKILNVSCFYLTTFKHFQLTKSNIFPNL